LQTRLIRKLRKKYILPLCAFAPLNLFFQVQRMQDNYNRDEVLKLTIFDIGINLWEIFDKEKVGEKEEDDEPHPK